MNTNFLIVFKKESDRNLNNYLMASKIIDNLKEEFCSDIIGIVNRTINCYNQFYEAASQYNKPVASLLQRNLPNFNPDEFPVACTLNNGDMILLVVSQKPYYLDDKLFNYTALKDKVMAVYPGVEYPDWYDRKDVFVVNGEKK